MQLKLLQETDYTYIGTARPVELSYDEKRQIADREIAARFSRQAHMLLLDYGFSVNFKLPAGHRPKYNYSTQE